MKTFCLLLTSAFCAWGQSALTNDTIVKMVKGDLGESLIINLIQSQSGTYSLGTDDLIALKQQGVSDKIIVAMMAKTPAAASLSPSTSAAKSLMARTTFGIPVQSTSRKVLARPAVTNIFQKHPRRRSSWAWSMDGFSQNRFTRNSGPGVSDIAEPTSIHPYSISA